MLDLLSEPQATDGHAMFDIELLAGRLVRAAAWLRALPALSARRSAISLPVPSAAAAIWAAAAPEADMAALVLLSGRPDVVRTMRLAAATAPTLLKRVSIATRPGSKGSRSVT